MAEARWAPHRRRHRRRGGERFVESRHAVLTGDVSTPAREGRLVRAGAWAGRSRLVKRVAPAREGGKENEGEGRGEGAGEGEGGVKVGIGRREHAPTKPWERFISQPLPSP